MESTNRSGHTNNALEMHACLVGRRSNVLNCVAANLWQGRAKLTCREYARIKVHTQTHTTPAAYGA